MNITIGRGRNRKTFIIPCSDIIRRSPDKDQALLSSNLVSLLGVKS